MDAYRASEVAFWNGFEAGRALELWCGADAPREALIFKNGTNLSLFLKHFIEMQEFYEGARLTIKRIRLDAAGFNAFCFINEKLPSLWEVPIVVSTQNARVREKFQEYSAKNLKNLKYE